jgi:hypothetical protein
MGQRQEKLSKIIYTSWNEKKHLKPHTSEILNSNYSNFVFDLYGIFKGQLATPPTRFGAWDISTSGFILELDEERHFNRYRQTSLHSPFYRDNKYFSISDYKRYCEKEENTCLRAASWGKNWKNSSTEKQFCKSDLEGQLSTNGSSRWKQRAFYDFLKDISSKLIHIPILRISIYDTYNGFSVDQLLKTNRDHLLLDLINEKITLVN